MESDAAVAEAYSRCRSQLEKDTGRKQGEEKFFTIYCAYHPPFNFPQCSFLAKCPGETTHIACDGFFWVAQMSLPSTNTLLESNLANSSNFFFFVQARRSCSMALVGRGQTPSQNTDSSRNTSGVARGVRKTFVLDFRLMVH